MVQSVSAMPLTVNHIHTIIAAVDAGWSPAELVADMQSGLDHFGLASINAQDSTSSLLGIVSSRNAEEKDILVSEKSEFGFYNRTGQIEYEEEVTVASVITI